eukprot:TRINITY_DN13167_c0_g1_i1.p1 TRINITY_DN13167_c0_g1~~TRINITY_DN13167_c0_g1_i1.p1  ORF type:complete len:121 (-),score=11.69 TRINITY_DN13167_c0_g1_i1:22-384(-)
MKTILYLYISLAVVFMTVQSQEIPSEYQPPVYPGYTPTCQNNTTAYPYYYASVCTQVDPLHHCKWSHVTDCRYSSHCPYSYWIKCTQYGNQQCEWAYEISCASTTPPPASCPWNYNISCF